MNDKNPKKSTTKSIPFGQMEPEKPDSKPAAPASPPTPASSNKHSTPPKKSGK